MNKKVIGKVIECLACVGLFAATWRINSISQTERDLEKALIELKETKDLLNEANNKVEETQGQLDSVKGTLDTVNGALNDSLEELDSIKEELENVKNRVSKDEVYAAFLKGKQDILYGFGDAR